MIGSLMQEYLSNHKEMDKLFYEIKALTERRKQLYDRQLVIKPLLEDSVDPVCGSATKPHIYTYTDGTYTTISVFYDRDLGKGRINITSNAPIQHEKP